MTHSYLNVRYVGKLGVALSSAVRYSHPLFDILRKTNRNSDYDRVTNSESRVFLSHVSQRLAALTQPLTPVTQGVTRTA